MPYIYAGKDLPSYLPDPLDQALFVAFLRARYTDSFISQYQDNYGSTSLLNVRGVTEFVQHTIDDLEASITTTTTSTIASLNTTTSTNSNT